MLNYNYDKKRFETFIDAVIAIILTILVLELKVPESAHGSTREQFFSLLPSFVSYLASFMLIVGVSIDYNILYNNLALITKRYILLTMLFIFSLSVVPFSTVFSGQNHTILLRSLC